MQQIAEEVAVWRAAAAAQKVERQRWLLMAEVVEYTRLPEPTVRQYVRQRKLRAYKVGTNQQLRFRLEDVNALFHVVEPKD
ncbi:MAG: helix-turn-helix domain-containing protein [Mycobacterium sp.]